MSWRDRPGTVVLVRAGVGPLAQQDPDRRLDLAVPAGGVRRDAQVLEAVAREDLLEACAMDVAPSVVGHHLADPHAEVGEVMERPLAEGGAGARVGARQAFDVPDPGAIVDRDVQVVPAELAGSAIAHERRVDALAPTGGDAAQLLGVDVDEITRALAFVAVRCGQRDAKDAAVSQSQAAQHRIDGRARDAQQPRKPERAPAAAPSLARDPALDLRGGAPGRVPRPARAQHEGAIARARLSWYGRA